MYILALVALIVLLVAVAALRSQKASPVAAVSFDEAISPLLKTGDLALVSPHADQVVLLDPGRFAEIRGRTVLVPSGYWIPPQVPAREKPQKGQKIPRVIYQSFYTCCVQPCVAAAVSHTIEANPSYEYRFFDDVSCLHMLETAFVPRVAEAYKALLAGAYKCDLWRLCALYLHGGVYADIRYQMLQPLDETLGDASLVLVNDDIPEYFCVHNCFMAATPRSPVLAAAIRRVVRTVEMRQYGTETLDLTGPHSLGRSVTAELGVKRLPRSTVMPDGGILRSLNHSARDYAHLDWDGRVVARTKMQGARDASNIYEKCGKTHYGTLWRKHKVYADHEPRDLGELGALLRE